MPTRLLSLVLLLTAFPAAAGADPTGFMAVPSGSLRAFGAPASVVTAPAHFTSSDLTPIALLPISDGHALSVPPRVGNPGPASPYRISDPWFALISTAGVATAYSLDQRVWATVSDSGAGGSHRVADAVAKFGDLRLLGPALLAGYVYGRIAKLPGASSASVRIAGSVVASGAASAVLKIATGRSRPEDSPGDHNEFDPFSGADAFPSGHTTVAFSFAAALDQETRSAWVPWIAYPAAAAVGWARIVQNRHWLSDVVAGAALGTWTGRRVDLMLQHRSHGGSVVSPLLQVSARRARAGVALRF